MKQQKMIAGLILGLIMGAMPHGASAAEEMRRPNVVILYTDDQGTLDVNSFGASDLRTPNMDRLARSGIKFTQAYAHSVCCPSRAALLTGRQPQRSGVNQWTQGNAHGPDGVNMHLDETTLAEALRDAGYVTGMFGKWHLGAKLDHGPESQGFEEFFGFRSGFIDNYSHYFLHGAGFHDLWDGLNEVHRRGDYFPDMVATRATTFIERHRDQPFFVYLAFNSPHYPYQPRAEDAVYYTDTPEPRRSYAGFVSTTDYYVGQVLDKLEALGLRENTLVVLQSDNGHSAENFQAIRIDDHPSGYPKGYDYGAHGGGGFTGKWIGHKYQFYEGGIRTPAILSYPARVPTNESRGQLVSVMDWYPTILDYCGIAAGEQKLDGRSLRPLVEDATAPSPHPIFQLQWQHNWMVREGNWKLIGTLKPGTVAPAGVELELVSLSGERPEQINFTAEHPEVVERLQNLHQSWVQEVMPPTK